MGIVFLRFWGLLNFFLNLSCDFRFHDRDYSSAPELRTLPEVAQALLALGGAVHDFSKKRKVVKEDFELEPANRKSMRKPKLSQKGQETSQDVSLGTRVMSPSPDAGYGQEQVLRRKNRGQGLTVSEMHFSLQKWLCLKMDMEEKSLPEEVSVTDLRKVTSQMILDYNQNQKKAKTSE